MLLALLAATSVAVSAYEEPPAPIAAILDAKSPPSVSVSPDGVWMLELERPSLRSLDELAAPRVKVAGIKLDPRTFGPSRPYLYRGLALRTVRGNQRTDLALPDDARVGNVSWHRDSDKLSFTLTSAEGLSLWVATTDGALTQLTEPVLNATYGAPCDWLPGDQVIIATSKRAK